MASSQPVSSLQETDEKSCVSDIGDLRPTKEFYILPIPTRLRYNPELPFKFTYGIAVAYAVVGTLSKYRNTFFVTFSTLIGLLLSVTANLYFCQPLLSKWPRFLHNHKMLSDYGCSRNVEIFPCII